MTQNNHDSKKIALFLARFQPLHNAHLYVIETALKECDEVVIALGSSNKKDMLRNPFDFELRKSMLAGSLKNKADYKRIKIFEIPDWSQESIIADNKVWGHYLYYNTVSRAGQKNLILYYSDEPKIVKDWFDDEVSPYISYRFMERASVFDGLSATKIRYALLNFTDKDKEYLKNFLPNSVYNNIEQLRQLWIGVNEHPKDDFSMQ